MKIIYVIFISHFWSVCFCQGLVDKSNAVSVPYKTINLKNEYSLVYGASSTKRDIRLVGPDVDTIIRVRDIRASDKLLGTVWADFDNYFVLFIGEGERGGVEIYQKQWGRNVIKGMSLDIDTINGIVYYIDTNKNRELGIFDAATGKNELFSAPNTPCLWWFECLTSKKLTATELIIEYAGWNNKRQQKIYTR